MEINQQIVNQFFKITKYDLKKYFQDFFVFTDLHAVNVTNFFGGVVAERDRISFKAFEDIKRVTKKVLNLIDNNSRSLNSTSFFFLNEQIEDIQHYLDILTNYPKFAKTFLKNGNFVRKIVTQHNLKQNESLENVQKEIGLRGDYQDSWQEIARLNKLREEDTKPDSGQYIEVEIGTDTTFSLDSVMKGIQNALDTYGIDINGNIQIDLEKQDIDVLNEQETLNQSAYILLATKKGEDPYNPSIGIDRRLVGSNQAIFSYNTLIRNIIESFGSDDTFSSVTIESIQNIDDSIHIKVKIRDRAGEFKEFEANISN